jgi:hypothetical protein
MSEKQNLKVQIKALREKMKATQDKAEKRKLKDQIKALRGGAADGSDDDDNDNDSGDEKKKPTTTIVGTEEQREFKTKLMALKRRLADASDKESKQSIRAELRQLRDERLKQLGPQVDRPPIVPDAFAIAEQEFAKAPFKVKFLSIADKKAHMDGKGGLAKYRKSLEADGSIVLGPPFAAKLALCADRQAIAQLCEKRAARMHKEMKKKTEKHAMKQKEKDKADVSEDDDDDDDEDDDLDDLVIAQQ